MNAKHAAKHPHQPGQPAMSEQAKIDAKVQKPSTCFDEPQDVLVDSSLSKAQKVETLDTLEQDARQLAEASSEGMGGGECNNLHEVLLAKDTLTLPSVADAYETVRQDLQSRQKREPAINTRVLLEQAIAALDGLLASSAQRPTDTTPTLATPAR